MSIVNDAAVRELMPEPVFTPIIERVRAQQAFYRLAYNTEDSDCSVRALAVTCAAPYTAAHCAMHFAGRPPYGAATVSMIDAAAHSLGFELRRVEVKSRTLRKLCVELADEPGAYMAMTCDHVVGFWQGECIDWARDMALRIELVCAVLKMRTQQ